MIDKDFINKELKLKDKDKLADSLASFDINNNIDLLELDKLIIKEYSKNTFYKDLNNWLLNSQKEFYEPVAYFTARLMYSLNSFAKNEKEFFKDNKILYRGVKMPYSSLLPYEKAKGGIIVLSSFTSTSKNLSIATKFSARKDSLELYKTNLLFSVIYYITNIWNENWIPNGINIQNESVFKNEKEVLYQPFTFYHVKDVVINLDIFTADIHLETIGKTCILEEEIKKGKILIYNETQNIIKAINK